MNRIYYPLFISILFTTILVVACSDKDNPFNPLDPDSNNNDTQTAIISFGTIDESIEAKAGSAEVELKANCAWKASSNVS